MNAFQICSLNFSDIVIFVLLRLKIYEAIILALVAKTYNISGMHISIGCFFYSRKS